MTTTDTPSVRVDETLARFRDLQAQFERVRDRLRRAEEQKTTVSRRTFDKVRAEYDRELDALRAKMTPLRDELESHRSSVEGGLKDANASLESLEEELAEAVFRNRVGEYTDVELAERRKSIEARLGEARARIADQRHTLDLFDSMKEPESGPASPERFADAPVVPRQVSREPAPPEAAVRATAIRDATRDARADDRSAPVPVAPIPLGPNADLGANEEPQTIRRPTLRAKNTDGSTPSAPAEPAPVTTQSDARTHVKSEAAFENPHDWIKEMGRDSAGSQRSASAPDAPRPHLGGKSPSAPATLATGDARSGTSRMPSLVFVNGPHAGESIPLLPTTLTIGREHDNNIELKDPDVARYHARIVHERGHYVVEDLDSTTGTWVNGQRTKKTPLNHGDVVRVGSTEIAIDFEWASDPV